MSNNVLIETSAGRVEGYCEPQFQGVCDAFVENFESRRELGANVAITLEGKTVVDLWGGHKTPGGDAWERDTLSVVFSSTKGATALCAHLLADRGLLDLDAPVSQYWPEYASNGKEDTRVSMLLDHSAGVPHVRTKVKEKGYNDYEYMVDLVENEAPFWAPGSRQGYHGMTFAWTVGELVHRVAGKRLGAFFQEEVADPLGLDFWIGLPEEHETRVAPMLYDVPDEATLRSRFSQTVQSDPESPSHLFLLNGGNTKFNDRETHAAEIGSAGGITNGRGLAGMYEPLANGGGDLVSEHTLSRMGRTAMATHEDATLLIPTRFALGFMKSMDNRKVTDAPGMSCRLSDAAFGHVGMGGSIGFADPEAKMSFGYNMNQMGNGILLNERGQTLVDACYQAMDYTECDSGVWRA